MTIAHAQPIQQPGKLRRSVWIAGGVFVLLLITTTLCGSMFNDTVPPSEKKAEHQDVIRPGQTETIAQQVLATVRAANATGTQCITDPKLLTPYVAIWEMFGTPTLTPTRTPTPVR